MDTKTDLRALVCLQLAPLPSIALDEPQSSDIVDSWVCGPYEMTGLDFVVSVTERTTYSSDGKVIELGTGTYTFADGTQVRFKTNSEGNWLLTGDVIEIRYTSATFRGLGNPTISVAARQALKDAPMQRKDWSKTRVLEYGERLITIPAESVYKVAEVVVFCSKD